MTDDTAIDQEWEEQLRVTLEHLEIGHGNALKFNKPGEAEAYYHAIKDVETALECGWDLDRHARRETPDFFVESIERSRKAREDGAKAATLYEERRRERYRQPTILDRILPWRWTP